MGRVNKVMLMGNTTRKPEIRILPSGTKVCDFGLATNRVYKTVAGEEKQETVFIDCTAFGRVAEVVAEFCPKGRQLFVEGRLHFETWEDSQGNRRSKLSVIVENFQFIGARDQMPGAQRELPLNTAPKKEAAKPVMAGTAANRGRADATAENGNQRGPAKKAVATRRVLVTSGATKSAEQKAGATDADDVDLPF